MSTLFICSWFNDAFSATKEERRWIVKNFKGSSHCLILWYYPDICQEGLRKTSNKFSQFSRSPDRDLNAEPPEYSAGVSTTQLRHSVNIHDTSFDCFAVRYQLLIAVWVSSEFMWREHFCPILPSCRSVSDHSDISVLIVGETASWLIFLGPSPVHETNSGSDPWKRRVT
jgi:hypothetical protein